MKYICQTYVLLWPIVSQETGFVGAIVKKDLHTVMLLLFPFFDYQRTMSQIKLDYFNSEIYMNTYIYIVNTITSEEFMVSGNVLKLD